MDIAAFDAWRAAYDTLSYADQQAFYDRLEAEHPVQAGYNAAAYAALLAYAAARLPLVYVLEFGGWKGELAELMLNQRPSIGVWCNVEICRAAVGKSVFAHPRYIPWLAPDFPWHVELPPGNVVVASHFIEHIRRREVQALLHGLGRARFLGIQAPLTESAEGYDWSGYHGSHILEIGWSQLERLISGWGWRRVAELSDTSGIGEFRAYER